MEASTQSTGKGPLANLAARRAAWSGAEDADAAVREAYLGTEAADAA